MLDFGAAGDLEAAGDFEGAGFDGVGVGVAVGGGDVGGGDVAGCDVTIGVNGAPCDEAAGVVPLLLQAASKRATAASVTIWGDFRVYDIAAEPIITA